MFGMSLLIEAGLLTHDPPLWQRFPGPTYKTYDPHHHCLFTLGQGIESVLPRLASGPAQLASAICLPGATVVRNNKEELAFRMALSVLSVKKDGSSPLLSQTCAYHTSSSMDCSIDAVSIYFESVFTGVQ